MELILIQISDGFLDIGIHPNDKGKLLEWFNDKIRRTTWKWETDPSQNFREISSISRMGFSLANYGKLTNLSFDDVELLLQISSIRNSITGERLTGILSRLNKLSSDPVFENQISKEFQKLVED
jgi:hypothetical protein